MPRTVEGARGPPARLEELADAVVECADAITRELGGKPGGSAGTESAVPTPGAPS